MKHTAFLLFLIALLATACEKQIDFTGEVSDALVVMQSKPAAGDTLTLRLSYSRFFLDSAPFRMIDNANLRLTVNGTPVTAAATYHADRGLYTIAYVPQAGDNLAITATVAGHDPVTAATVIPAMPVIDGTSLAYINPGASEYGSGRQYAAHFSLHDDANQQNYYLLRFKAVIDRIELDYYNSAITIDTIVHRDTTYNADSSTVYITIDTTFLRDTTLAYDTIPEELYVSFGCRDYLLLEQDELSLGDETTYNELYFTDAKINGLNHEVQVTLSLDDYLFGEYEYGEYYPAASYDTNSLQLTMYITSFSRDLYLYELSTQQQMSEFGSLFSEPTQIHTNVSGGIGIFAGSSTVAIPLAIQ